MTEQTRAVAMVNGQPTPISVVPTIAVTLSQAKARILDLQAFVRDLMIEGEDFGRIPGMPKPTLFKPGAEKLCDIYGFAKTAEVVHRIEDWTDGLFHYEVKVTLTSKATGYIEAEGLGSCNSKEKRYRSQDVFTIPNTLLKMAKKRALVDAVLSATRTSGLFTQDMEDEPPKEKVRAPERPAPIPHRPAPPPVAKVIDAGAAPVEQPAPTDKPTRAQVAAEWHRLLDKAEALGIAVETMSAKVTTDEAIARCEYLAAQIADAEAEIDQHDATADAPE